MSECLLSPVEHHDDAVWLVIFNKGVQHGAKAVHRICYLTTRGSHICRQGKEGAIRQRVAIKRHQFHSVMNITNEV